MSVLFPIVEETKEEINVADGERDADASRLKVVGRERVWKSVDEGNKWRSWLGGFSQLRRGNGSASSLVEGDEEKVSDDCFGQGKGEGKAFRSVS